VVRRAGSSLLLRLLHRLFGLVAVALTLLRKTLRFVGVAALERLRRSLTVICGHLKRSAGVPMDLRLLLMRLLLFVHVVPFDD
jgi:hypothetical protein